MKTRSVRRIIEWNA